MARTPRTWRQMEARLIRMEAAMTEIEAAALRILAAARVPRPIRAETATIARLAAETLRQ